MSPLHVPGVCQPILGDPGADSGGEEKSKRATKKTGEEIAEDGVSLQAPILLTFRYYATYSSNWEGSVHKNFVKPTTMRIR